MADVRDDKELLRGRPPIHRLSMADESFLNKGSQALTFAIRRLQSCPLEERQPGRQCRIGKLMRGVICLHSRRLRPRRIVEMNTYEYAMALLVCDGGAIRQRDVSIVIAREPDSHALKLQAPLRAMRDIERKLLLQNPGLHRSGILTTVPGIEHDDSERFFDGSRSDRGLGS